MYLNFPPNLFIVNCLVVAPTDETFIINAPATKQPVITFLAIHKIFLFIISYSNLLFSSTHIILTALTRVEVKGEGVFCLIVPFPLYTFRY